MKRNSYLELLLANKSCAIQFTIDEGQICALIRFPSLPNVPRPPKQTSIKREQVLQSHMNKQRSVLTSAPQEETVPRIEKRFLSLENSKLAKS